MKKISPILLLMLIVLSSVSYAQIKHTKFSRVITIDTLNTFSTFYNTSISEIPLTGGYFLSNYKDDSQLPDFKASTIKLDYQGNILFDTVYSFNPINPSGNANIVNNKTNLSGNAILYNTSYANSGSVSSPYLIKTDLNGNLLWHYGYSDNSVELETKQLVATQDGGYLILGHAMDWSSSMIDHGFAIKVNPSGVMQWHQLYANKDTMTVQFNDGIEIPNGDLFMVGTSFNFQGGARTLGMWDILVTMLKTDNNGNTIWNKGITIDAPIDNTSGFSDLSCGMLGDSNVFVSFSVRDSSVNKNKFAVASVNINTGNTNWVNYYSLPPSEEMNIREAISDREGNIIISGSDYNTGTGMLFKIDGLGNVVTTKRFAIMSNAHYPNHTIKTQDGGFAHLNEIDGKNILFVKTDIDLDPSCPNVDSTYFTLTPLAINDTSYFGYVDSVRTLSSLSSSQMTAATPVAIEVNDSLICSCSNTLTGIVYDGASPAVNAKVFLFKKGFVPKPWQAYDSTITDALGSYSFYDFPTDSFLVKVEPDPLLQPNAIKSYYKQVGFCFKWDSAGVFYVHCDSGIVTNDIDLINITPMSGNSSLNGYVFENTGGFSKGSNGIIPGDPIPDIDITVEQSPGGIVGAGTTGGNGYYDLPNLDNNATYVISIDFPGLPNDSIYTMVISLSDTIFDSLNFYIDTTGIYIVTGGLGVGVNVIDFDDLKVDIYPNPSSNDFNLKISALKPEEVTYEVMNEFGQSILKNHKKLHQGENNIILETDDLSKGIYFLKIKQANKIYIKKLIKF